MTAYEKGDGGVFLLVGEGADDFLFFFGGEGVDGVLILILWVK